MALEKITYSGEVRKAMNFLSEDERVLFIGQTVEYGGSRFTKDLSEIVSSKKLELPVAEELQMGMSIGLALEGIVPVSIFPRFDFLLLGMNQLVNHLDKIKEMSKNEFNPKIIIRTIIGGKNPYPGPQHCQDYTFEFKSLLKNIYVKKLEKINEIFPEYKKALKREGSSLLIELGDLYI